MFPSTGDQGVRPTEPVPPAEDPTVAVTVCDRCTIAPGTRRVQEICSICDDVLLCEQCFVMHQLEVTDDTDDYWDDRFTGGDPR